MLPRGPRWRGDFVRDEPCDPRDLYVGKNPWGDAFAGRIDELTIYDGVF